MHRLWRDHSKTVVGLVTGIVLIAWSRWHWPDGGADFDLATIVGALQLGDGLQGIKDWLWTEVNKAEE